MKQITDIKEIYFEKTQGGEFRWITISVVLLALGAILHLVAPGIGGITPNFLIGTYVIAILILKPSLKEALGIGFVAGLIQMMTSKSSFPYGNLASEQVGSFVAYLLATYIGRIRIGGLNIMPAIAGFLVTMFSGCTFVSVLVALKFVPIQVAFFVIGPVVVISALVNLVLAMLLYFPTYGFMLRKGIINKDEIRESDHSKLVLEPSQEGKISIEHLTYTYPRSEKPALKDISLAIEDGEFIMLAGASGCGKTTLALSFTGAIPHFYGGKMQGMVFVDKEAITKTRIPDLAMNIGIVLADFDTQLVTMTIGEEVAFAMENRGFAKEDIKVRSKEVLAKVGLAGLEYRKVTDLSGGQRQRLAIAAALATNPDILVLDEPTSALDPEATKYLYKLLGEINKEEKMTIIVVENSIEPAINCLDRIALLENGALKKVGPVNEVMDFMYDEDVYKEALPKLYITRRNLEKQGINLPKDLDINVVKEDLRKRISHKEVGEVTNA